MPWRNITVVAIFTFLLAPRLADLFLSQFFPPAVVGDAAAEFQPLVFLSTTFAPILFVGSVLSYFFVYKRATCKPLLSSAVSVFLAVLLECLNLVFVYFFGKFIFCILGTEIACN